MRSGRSDPTGALVLGIGAGVFFFLKGFRVFREYQVVQDTPRIPIRSVPMGLVHIRGRAQSQKLISSPLTHTPCCFYQVRIERYESGKNGGWKPYRTDNDGSKFLLQDDTGTILIDSHSAEYELLPSPPRVVDSQRLQAAVGSGASDQELLQYVEYAGAHALKDKMEHWLEKKGSLANPKAEQARQSFLTIMKAMPGNLNESGAIPAAFIEKMVEARGPMDDPSHEMMRQAFLQRLHEGELPAELTFKTGSASGRYRITEALILPGEEYCVTGTCTENIFSDQSNGTKMIAKGEREKTFLVSCKSEKETQTGLRSRAMKMVFGGAALTIICLILLLAHLKMF